MNMRNYSALLLDINSSKGTTPIIAVLHFTVTVGSSACSIKEENEQRLVGSDSG
jgi:hypothetical protein